MRPARPAATPPAARWYPQTVTEARDGGERARSGADLRKRSVAHAGSLQDDNDNVRRLVGRRMRSRTQAKDASCCSPGCSPAGGDDDGSMRENCVCKIMKLCGAKSVSRLLPRERAATRPRARADRHDHSGQRHPPGLPLGLMRHFWAVALAAAWGTLAVDAAFTPRTRSELQEALEEVQQDSEYGTIDVSKVTDMYQSECTTVHPRVVSSSCLLSRLHLSLSLPFLIPHTYLSSSSSSLDVLPLHHQCFILRNSSTETSRHGMSGVSTIWMPVSVLLSIPAVLSLPHVSSPVSISLSLPFLITHTHLSSSSSSLDVPPLHHQC